MINILNSIYNEARFTSKSGPLRGKPFSLETSLIRGSEETSVAKKGLDKDPEVCYNKYIYIYIIYILYIYIDSSKGKHLYIYIYYIYNNILDTYFR